ncbi:MAG: multicopper oxidase family protein [Betaproteobacteria bacterium]|nr:MAG: multicopper oxidase family protein [Betaproteobacteria bacterium]
MTKQDRLYARRNFLKSGTAAALLPWLPGSLFAAGDDEFDYQLTASVSGIRLADEPFPETKTWSFNRQSPGPLLRLRRGETVRVAVKNELPQELTVHWHGLRITNAMDGVPILTQPPITPGDTFVYRYTPPDAGTFWYHSHVNTAEQVGRGLYGPIIVEEPEAPPVDRDLVWVLDDWKLDQRAQIVADFDNRRDLARAGRLGNTVTINGRIPQSLSVRAGERLRLRLINAANARIFALRFRGHRTLVIARDGQPVDPYEPGGPVVIGPAQRFDLIFDMTGEPGQRYSVIDVNYPQSPSRLTDIEYLQQARLPDKPAGDYPGLPRNNIPQPDLRDPLVQPIVLAGGDLGQLTHAQLGGQRLEMTRLYLLGKMWAINDIVNTGYSDTPLFAVERGKTVILEFRNHSAWPHPMHLHGHHFQVLEHSRDREVTGKWLDTVLLGPEESARVAFVADNPGDWLFHCHILGHARAGMMAVIRVS